MIKTNELITTLLGRGQCSLKSVSLEDMEVDGLDTEPDC